MNLHANRVFGLDALRAFAILTTVYAHGYALTDFSIPAEVYSILELDGVTMFFVLSGFLIGRIVLRTIAKRDFGAKMLVEFWIRRWFRTLPNYMLVLVLLVIANHLSGTPQPGDLIAYFLFSQNIAAPPPIFFGEAWSLSVEEWFYLAIPIPLYLLTRSHRLNRETAVMIWIVGVIVSVTAFRFYRAYHYGYSTLDEWDLNLRKQVVTRLDSIMYGVLGAYLSIYKPDSWRGAANKAFWVGIFLHVSLKVYWDAMHNAVFMNYFALTVVPGCTLLLLPKLSDMNCISGKMADTITFISLISYSMYLIHGTLVQTVILPIIMDSLAKSLWIAEHIHVAQYLAYWIITFAGSFLLYRCFERPTTAMRDKMHVRGQVAVKAFTDIEANVKGGSFLHQSEL